MHLVVNIMTIFLTGHKISDGDSAARLASEKHNIDGDQDLVY